ncbi:MAG: hypothetical protein KAR17_22240 [Cyclobacteriaceae bacterium]|nr:hypothetical protein [Cyclobacteriaceae bacterium]
MVVAGGSGQVNGINLSSYCPALERVKACPPDQAGRGFKKYALINDIKMAGGKSVVVTF